MSDRDRPVVAIIGAGQMGAAVGRRLLQCGAAVRTSLRERSPRSAERVRRARIEVTEDDISLVRDCDFVLSIVPPAAALKVAERFREPLGNCAHAPIFVDCNAVSPATARRMGDALGGAAYVDAGIIGGPPSEDPNGSGPRFYASGPFAKEFLRLGRFGLDIAVLEGPVGAASALKLCYAAITKGTIAIGAAMIAAAAREGLADAFAAELERTQPQVLSRLARQVPAMFPKAYRWVGEMEEIADFLGTEESGAAIYLGMARLYERIAAEVAGGEFAGGLDALEDFCASTLGRRSARGGAA